MGHPFSKFRQGNVERSRVGAITGEAAPIGDEAGKIKKTIKNVGGIEGVPAAMRMDRPQRASGGKVGKKATTVVNVITGGQQQPPAPPPMPMPPPGAMSPPPPPGPPPGALPPPGGPMGGPPGMPSGPPMRARGGGVKKADGGEVTWDQGSGRGMLEDRKYAGMRHQNGPYTGPARASGGGVKAIGMDVGTRVQHDKANTDPKNMNRKRVVTFNTGGGVKSFMAGGSVKGVTFKAGADPKSDLPGGGGGGKARLAKMRKY